MGHQWRPIERLPDSAAELSDGELKPVTEVWADIRERMRGSGAIERFNERLHREWAIETGQIEGIYDVDRGVTETLIERGIESSIIPSRSGGERTARIIQDHLNVLDGLFDFVKGERPLTVGYIKELHAALLQNQETYDAYDSEGKLVRRQLDKGKFKIHTNSVRKRDGSIHEYCPAEHVAAEMDRLIELNQEHEQRGLPVEVRTAWLHHAFAQIHPFADGNGRVARAIASIQLIRDGLFPFLVRRDERVAYLDALEAGDEGSLGEFVNFVVRGEVSQVIEAAQAVDAKEAAPLATVEEEIAAAKAQLRFNIGAGPTEHVRALSTAEVLTNLAAERFTALAERLAREFSAFESKFQLAHISGTDGMNGRSDSRVWSNGVGVYLETGEKRSYVMVSAFGIGPTFRGIAGVEAHFWKSQEEPRFDWLPIMTLKHSAGCVGPLPEAPHFGNSILVSPHLFQTNYREPAAQAKARFAKWLEESLRRGLAEWRRQL